MDTWQEAVLAVSASIALLVIVAAVKLVPLSAKLSEDVDRILGPQPGRHRADGDPQ